MNDERLLQVRFPAKPDRLRMVRALVHGAAETAGCSSEVASQLVIAVNEACMNVMQHAYKGDRSGEIILEILNNGKELTFVLTDFAEVVDPARLKPRNLDEVRPGGLGMHFIKEIMDDYKFGQLADQCGNYLRMTRRIQ